MKRRSFIKAGSAISLPFFVGGVPFTAVGRNQLFNLIGDDNDKVLVLIQLQGGNDGLSTLIPLEAYDTLATLRSNILVPQNSLLEIPNSNGFHPSMGSMKEIWDQEKLHIVQSVAYPDQNRSHFRSTDIWNTGSGPDEFLTTGWMGRYFELNHSTFPVDYPNETCPDPFALTIGSLVSETCQGVASNFSLAVTDPFNPGTINEGSQDEVPNNCYGSELTFVREVARQTNAYADVIESAADKGNNLSQKYLDGSNLSEKLKIVARLISGGLQTKVYVVQLGGFDLHSDMVDNGDVTQGSQSNLLLQLSDAICAFQDDLNLLGVEERVVGMTYSEFGRRIRSNDASGSDHGTAAPLFVFGSCVNPEITGDNPEIDTQVDINEGVAMQYDFRSVYASILMDWFSISEDQVKDVLFEDFQHIPIIKGCETVPADDLDNKELSFDIFPNPCSNYAHLTFTSKGEWLRISLFDVRGAEIRVISAQNYSAGSHKIVVPTNNLSSGSYFVRIQGKMEQKTKKLSKL